MVKHERSVLAEPERMPGLRSSFLCKFLIKFSFGKLFGKIEQVRIRRCFKQRRFDERTKRSRLVS